MNFCIRNFICEHSQEEPGESLINESKKKNRIPVFHIYGVTNTGKKGCLHIHGVLPYIVLRVGGKSTPAVHNAMRAKINRCIQQEIDFSAGKTTKYQQDYVYKMETISKKSIYGYQEELEDFVRVYFSSPWYLQKASFALGKEAIQKSIFQPFEAHLPFYLQFFIDNSIFGMDNIYVKNVKFRIDPEDDDNAILHENIKVKDVKERIELLSPFKKSTTCSIECDANVKDILNIEMHKENLHSTNPGLEYIWREEKERCDAQGIDLIDVFNSYEKRNFKIYAQEKEMLKNARSLARTLRNETNMSVCFPETQESMLEMNSTIWETEKDGKGSINCDQNNFIEKNEEDEEEKEEEEEEEIENELEMTQIIEKNKEEITIESSDDDSDKDENGDKNQQKQEKLKWITSKSAYRQKFIVPNFLKENENKKQRELNQKRSTISREMSCCSVITDEDDQIMIESSSQINKNPLLSQTTMNETQPESERSGESDIAGLCVASLELLIKTDEVYPEVKRDPIMMASIAIFDDICRNSKPKQHSVLIDKSIIKINEKHLNEKSEIYYSESEIMERIAQLIVDYDVDLLIGYDTQRLSWGYFMRRAKLIGIETNMNRIKEHRDEWNSAPELLNDEMRIISPKGRLMISVWQIIRSDLALKSYDLGAAAGHLLKKKIPIINCATFTKRLSNNNETTSQDVQNHYLKLSKINISLLIEMNWFLKNTEMARVYGIQFHEVWTRGSQIRVESMLLRLARKMDFVAPSVTSLQRNLMTSPEQLQLVMEPKSNVYFDPIIVLDFQSLYPSMVIAYNYCYSSILGRISNLEQMTDSQTNKEEIMIGALKYQADKENLVKLIAHRNVISSPLASLFVKKTVKEGVLPLLLREILSARIMIKNAMKRATSKKLKRILDARQLALKLVANVSYGYTAANWSGRMPCSELADAILGKGRETLEKSIEMVRNGEYNGAEVIYGDTDSMFVLVKNATIEKAFEIGRKIAEDVTNSNPDPVVLKLEKVYKGCVLETKKRYAGWMFEHEKDEGKFEAKGIETVRRDTCPIVSEILEKSLELIFSRKWQTFSSYLNGIITSIHQQNFSKFVFCKEYRGDYSKNAMVPQKKIAEKREKLCKNDRVLKGERVAYLIVDGSPGSTVYSCVTSVQDYADHPNLKINYSYYLNSHILAALRRVTDLLPIKIDVLPLSSNQCYNSRCNRIGATPWCIECRMKEEELAMAFVQVGRISKAKSFIRETCKMCQSSTHFIEDFKIGECSNFSCLAKQTWIRINREKLSNVIKCHKFS